MSAVTHKTVDPNTLPSHEQARNATYRASKAIWDELREVHGIAPWHDYWVNSTPTTGIREIRIRVVYATQEYDDNFRPVSIDRTNEDLIYSIVQKYAEQLSNEMPADTVKVYKYHSYMGYYIAIKQYYRSWQPGEVRAYESPDEGYALTFRKGDRIEYRTHTGKLVKATILKRGSSLSYRPHYRIRTDEPRDEPIKGKIEDLPEWQQDWYYETYALEPDVRALEE